jgi:hypothetical protein
MVVPVVAMTAIFLACGKFDFIDAVAILAMCRIFTPHSCVSRLAK